MLLVVSEAAVLEKMPSTHARDRARAGLRIIALLAAATLASTPFEKCSHPLLLRFLSSLDLHALLVHQEERWPCSRCAPDEGCASQHHHSDPATGPSSSLEQRGSKQQQQQLTPRASVVSCSTSPAQWLGEEHSQAEASLLHQPQRWERPCRNPSRSPGVSGRLARPRWPNDGSQRHPCWQAGAKAGRQARENQ